MRIDRTSSTNTLAEKAGILVPLDSVGLQHKFSSKERVNTEGNMDSRACVQTWASSTKSLPRKALPLKDTSIRVPVDRSRVAG